MRGCRYWWESEIWGEHPWLGRLITFSNDASRDLPPGGRIIKVKRSMHCSWQSQKFAAKPKWTVHIWGTWPGHEVRLSECQFVIIITHRVAVLHFGDYWNDIGSRCKCDESEVHRLCEDAVCLTLREGKMSGREVNGLPSAIGNRTQSGSKSFKKKIVSSASPSLAPFVFVTVSSISCKWEVKWENMQTQL